MNIFYYKPYIKSQRKILQLLSSGYHAFKKNEWCDIPHNTYVKDKDIMGKWIECDICNVKIRIRSQFCFTEWDTHCTGVKHCRIANCETLKKKNTE